MYESDGERFEKRVAAMEMQLAELSTLAKSDHNHFRQILEQQSKWLARISASIYGNGQQGLKTVVGAHDQTLKLMLWVMAATCGTTLTLGIKAVFDTVVLGK